MRPAFLSGALAATVDLAMQKRPRDLRRTARVASYAFVSTFPQNSFFKNLGRVCKNPVEKMLCTQFVFAPINIAAGIAWNLAFQKKFDEIASTIKKNIGPGLIEGGMYWIPLNLIGFKMFKPEDQIYFFKLASVPYKVMFVRRTTR
jgi:hypothetical protein